MNIIKETHPIARKQHTCMLCGCSIKIGERYNRQSIFDGFGIFDATCHENCVDLIDKLDINDEGDGISQDNFQAVIDDYLSTQEGVNLNGLSYLDKANLILATTKKN